MNTNSTDLSVSLIIPTFNGRQLLSQNLPAVIEGAPNAEIIVVDDASTDDTEEFIKQKYPQVKLVINQQNQRFAQACNAGVKIARGEIIVLLNNDVRPEPGFLAPLLAPFSNKNVFGVGCREIDPETNLIQGRNRGKFERGFLVHERCSDQTKTNTLWAFGGSGAFRREIWLKLGGMDPLFHPAYLEDLDLCYRARKRGFTIAFAPESVVYHHHETTHQAVLGNNNMQITAYKNSFVFMWKNITHPPYIRQHLVWLPYHLIFTTIRSRGTFLRGFYLALKLLPQIKIKRQTEIKETTVSDAEILQA